MNKVFIVDSSYEYIKMFLEHGWEVVSDIKYAHIVQFTGGSDVSPHLYGEEKHSKSHCNPARDEKERKIFEHCISIAMPMAGICRGGQFLNVMSGGKMYQHVSNHCTPHDIMDLNTGVLIHASSTHHQMMIPSEKGIVVAIASQGGVREKMNGFNLETKIVGINADDAEVVFYENTSSLCFQPHPEFSSIDFNPLKEYYFDCIKTFLI